MKRAKGLLNYVLVVLGAIGGFVYYYYWGCTSGCLIRSSPVLMTLYGALLGYLLAGALVPKGSGDAERSQEKE